MKPSPAYQRRLLAWSLGQLSGWVTTAEVLEHTLRAVRESDVDEYHVFGLMPRHAASNLRFLREEGACLCQTPTPSDPVLRWRALGPTGEMPLPEPEGYRTIPQFAGVPVKTEDGQEARVAQRGRELLQEAAFGRESAEVIAKLHQQVVDARNSPETAPKALEAMQAEIETLADVWRRRVAA